MLRLGGRLKKLREERNYSQEYLAHKLEMSQGNYCKLESDNHFPSALTLEKISNFYDIPLSELLTSDGQSQIQYNQDSPHAINALMVWQDAQKLTEELLSAKDKIIEVQAKQIEFLENELKVLRSN